MGEKQFWDIIRVACQGEWIVLAPDGEDDTSWDEFRWFRPLMVELKKLPPKDIAYFQFWFDEKIDALYTWDLWGAMRLLTGSESDNRFSFFRAWLVCMGKEVYEAALADPDTLADVIDPRREQDYTSGFCSPELNAWNELGLTTKDFDEVYDTFGTRRRPQITGEEWPSDITSTMLRQRYPRLALLLGVVDDESAEASQE